MKDQNKLPADSNSLIIGIISLLIAVTLGCCGLSIVGLILAIFGLINANKSLRLYDSNPEMYNSFTRGNVYSAKVVNIIALVLNAIITLILILVFAVQGFFLYDAYKIQELLERLEEEQPEVESEYYYDDSQDQQVIEMMDSLYQEQDSIKVQEN